MKKVKILMLAILMLPFVFWGCQNREDVVRIGAILPLTGTQATFGVSLKQGIDLGVESINASGGINGRRLEVIFEDSRSDARNGVSAFNKLTMVDRVPLVLGSLTSVILAIQPEADRQGVVLINTSAVSPLINEASTDFLFNLVINGETEAIAMARRFQSYFPGERIAVFHANNSSGIYVANAFTQALTRLGNTNFITEGHEPGATDFRIHLDRIRRSGARFGYIHAQNLNELADILRQTRELNIDMQWFAMSFIESSETIELAGDAANGIIYSFPKIYDEELYTDFQERFYSRNGIKADILATNSYEALQLVAAVMREYGTTAFDIQRGLRTADNLSGIFGQFRLSETGKQFVDRELLWKTIENGEFIILED